MYWSIVNHFYVIRPKTTEFGEITLRLGLLRRSRSSKVTEFGTNRKLICDFLLVINTNLVPILHRFRDHISFRLVKNRYIRLPLLWLTPQTEGFPSDDLRKILFGFQQIANVPNAYRNIAEKFNRLGRVYERQKRSSTFLRKKVHPVTWLEDFLTSKWPGSFTALHLMTCLTTLMTWKWPGCLDVLAPPLPP